MLEELIQKNRSYRRFDQNYPVVLTTLVELVDLARLSPSSRNLQALKFYLSADADTNNIIFPHLGWAGYLKNWSGPTEKERPTGYIIIINDLNIGVAQGADEGIAALAILLGAVEKGFGGCIIGTIAHQEKLSSSLELALLHKIKLIVALGKPAEKVQLLGMLNQDGDIRYWRDYQGIHHVPKRRLADIILPGGTNE